jgi:hypothetical protein
MKPKKNTGEMLSGALDSSAARHPLNTNVQVVRCLLLSRSEGADQHGADKCERNAHGQHVQLHGKVNGHPISSRFLIKKVYQIFPRHPKR